MGTRKHVITGGGSEVTCSVVTGLELASSEVTGSGVTVPDVNDFEDTGSEVTCSLVTCTEVIGSEVTVLPDC